MTADRCKETTTTTGTGDITLLGAVAQFQAFGTAFTSYPATVSYAIVGQSGTEWEVGVGTLTDATTLERTTVQASSNAGAVVNLSAGTKDVFATLTAADIAGILSAIAGKAAASHTHAAGDITGLAASATTNAIPRSNHTGTQDADTITDGTTNKVYTATEKTKLAGIATGATANSADATLLARANHTGTQAASTITGLAITVPTTESGTTIVLDSSNTVRAQKQIRASNSAAIAANVDATDTDLLVGDQWDIVAVNTGQVTIGGTGVTANTKKKTAPSTTTDEQGICVTLDAINTGAPTATVMVIGGVA